MAELRRDRDDMGWADDLENMGNIVGRRSGVERTARMVRVQLRPFLPVQEA